jgi:N-acetylated-alpha-linked acidic dipeptidase
LEKFKKSTDSLRVDFQNKIKANNVSESFNQSLYRAEQQLLNETGLPRRAWYKHTIYAPGFYTGYGVKTMPGIREGIEQRKWKEAQEQIETDAKAIARLADYFNDVIASNK